MILFHLMLDNDIYNSSLLHKMKHQELEHVLYNWNIYLLLLILSHKEEYFDNLYQDDLNL